MIINGEFTVHGGCFFKNYTLRQEEQIEYTFPTYTIGEGATCTILSPSEPSNFDFHFSSRSDLADLCVVPLEEYEDYCTVTEKTAKNGANNFTSYGFDLHSNGEKEIIKLFKTLSINKKDIDIVFTHASSKTEWEKYGKLIDIDEKIYHIYQKTGNLISASVPAAISLALDEKKIKKGDRILSWVGSAGMSFNATYFVF
jgi:3-oxoacyl-[acyl-carrier-protein] synthase III